MSDVRCQEPMDGSRPDDEDPAACGRPRGTPRATASKSSRRCAFLTSDICLLTPAASVHGLSPDTFSARAGLTRPVSYYAFFKGWLLLSQPPGCLGLPTSLTT